VIGGTDRPAAIASDHSAIRPRAPPRYRLDAEALARFKISGVHRIRVGRIELRIVVDVVMHVVRGQSCCSTHFATDADQSAPALTALSVHLWTAIERASAPETAFAAGFETSPAGLALERGLPGTTKYDDAPDCVAQRYISPATYTG
jgi:hypothetical protein